MLARTITAALASTALLVTVASAQTPTTATTDTATSTSNAASATMSSSQLQGEWRASKVVGLNVYNDNNEKLGSINDLLMDKGGNIKAVVLGVGGFLGMGEHLVAVPLDKVKFSSEPIAYTGTASTAPGAGGSMANRPASPTTMPPTTTTGSAATAPATKVNPWYPDHAV